MRAPKTASTLAAALLELSELTPLEKITVSDLSERCGISRKTFYYYFSGIPSLITWIFRRDLAALLEEEFDEGKLVYESQGLTAKSPTGSFPCYIRVKSGIRMLDHSRFFVLFAKALEDRKRFYQAAFRQCDAQYFSQYFFDLYQPELKKDIGVMLDGRHLNPASVEFLSEFYARAFTQDMIQRVMLGSPLSPSMAAERMGNHIHEAIYRELEGRRFSERR